MRIKHTLNPITKRFTIDFLDDDDDHQSPKKEKAYVEFIRSGNLFSEEIERDKYYQVKKCILKSQKGKRSGECWIYVQVTLIHKGKKIIKRFNTGISVLKNNWDDKKQHIKQSALDAADRNSKIDEFYVRIIKKIKDLIAGKADETSEDIRVLDSMFGTNKKQEENKSKSIISYIDKYINFRKGSGTPKGTLKEFTTCRNRIALFESETGIVKFSEINLSLSDQLKGYWSKKYHPNTIKKTFEIFITILNYYYERKEEMNLDMNDKFKSKEFGKIKEISQDPIALTSKEIDAIKEFDFEEYKREQHQLLDKDLKKHKELIKKEKFLRSGVDQKVETYKMTRDRMLLQIATGLRVSDLFNIKPVNVNLNNNRLRISPKKTATTKTSNSVVIPIAGMAKDVLTKYKRDTTKKPFKVADKNYNLSLKGFLEAVGLDELVEETKFDKEEGKLVTKPVPKYEAITSHNMRDTFITQAIIKGHSIPKILSWTGQSSYAVMKKYISLTERDLIGDIKLF